MARIKITRIVRKDTDKHGNPLISKKNGRPYTRLGLQCAEYGDKWLSGFSDSWNEGWKVGDTVEVDVQPDGEYLNIKKPDPMTELSKAIMNLSREIGVLRSRVDALENRQAPRRTAYEDIPVVESDVRFDESGAPLEPEPLPADDLPF